MSASTEAPKTIADAFRAVASARADQPVMLGSAPAWTFAALDRASDGVEGRPANGPIGRLRPPAIAGVVVAEVCRVEVRALGARAAGQG